MRYLILFLLLPMAVQAATISGTVYTLELDPVEAVVTLNSVPEQRIVAEDGKYSVQVSPGEYTLNAVATQDGERWVAEEELVVPEEGEFVIDLILLPDFSELDSFALDGQAPEIETNGENILLYIFITAVAIAAIVGVYFFFNKLIAARRKPNIDDEFGAAVIAIIKKNGGRITQKELRKHVPFSEAKVSLVIAELEEEGIVKKIKKGRGNILVLV